MMGVGSIRRLDQPFYSLGGFLIANDRGPSGSKLAARPSVITSKDLAEPDSLFAPNGFGRIDAALDVTWGSRQFSRTCINLLAGCSFDCFAVDRSGQSSVFVLVVVLPPGDEFS